MHVEPRIEVLGQLDNLKQIGHRSGIKVGGPHRDHCTLGQQQRSAQARRIPATGIDDGMGEALRQILALVEDRLAQQTGRRRRRLTPGLTPPGGPTGGRGLRVRIDQQGRRLCGKEGSQVGGDRRLSHAALGVDDRYPHFDQSLFRYCII